MGGGGVPSGGTYIKYGRIGSLKNKGEKPNSRYDLHNNNGEKIQSRWYNSEGKAMRNRDYKHGGNMQFPHDHKWVWNGEKGIRGKEHLAPDYENFR